jgi:hypothetical protein
MELLGIKVVSYWAGKIPENSELHFRSFAHNRGSNDTYKLYLDEHFSSSSSIPDGLLWLRNEPWFELEKIDLEKLMQEKGLRKFSYWKQNSLYIVIRRFKISILSFLAARFDQMSSLEDKFVFFKQRHIPSVGFSLNHADSFSGLVNHFTYRADLFRTLILSQGAKENNILYADLDICFLKPLNEFLSLHPYTSRWGTEDFANTCLLFVPHHSNSMKGLVQELQKTSSAWPWTLYSKENCLKYGIEIKPLKMFDPIWDRDFAAPGSDSSFFSDPEVADRWIAWLDEHSLAYHWHNNWTTPRDPESTYEILLRRFK